MSAVAGEIAHADGRVELADTSALESSPLYNEDLAPVPVARRTWTTYNYAALWISMAHCIPTYMLASGLMNSGMDWRQALFTILLGNTIVLAPILLNSHPGTKYGIPFPVFARAAYGTAGSNLPALMRARGMRLGCNAHQRPEPPGSDSNGTGAQRRFLANAQRGQTPHRRGSVRRHAVSGQCDPRQPLALRRRETDAG